MIYLSDRKVAQFLPGLRRAWPRPRINFSTPFGGLEVDTATVAGGDPTGGQLSRVVRRIEETARWYAEDDLRPGQWVAFEATMNYLLLDSTDTRMVLFVDVPFSEQDMRLLLHGSAQHLVGSGMIPATEELQDPFVERLLSGGASAPGALAALVDRNVADEHRPSLFTALRQMLASAQARTHPEMAAPMRGYARVTTGFRPGDQPGLLVASPLYVEFDDKAA
ncbi:SAVMC3_10250 family protein [Streptomyces coelicoflavus]|uniref:SAVMC3_10250 family protein n=1 Tax=Streptomyces coelicoflavus TaxID=285562 RepID=UPI0036B99D39